MRHSAEEIYMLAKSVHCLRYGARYDADKWYVEWANALLDKNKSYAPAPTCPSMLSSYTALVSGSLEQCTRFVGDHEILGCIARWRLELGK